MLFSLTTRRTLWSVSLVTILSLVAADVLAQGPGGRGRGRGPGAQGGSGRGPGGHGPGGQGQHGRGQFGGPGGQNDPNFAKDRDLFHQLLSNHDKIQRSVKRLDNGVETLTESDDPQVAKAIQMHVESMYGRVEENRPIHRRDPLFDVIFQHADELEMHVEKTPNGVRVRETSQNPYAVKLIQAHAEVVSLFVRNGHAEVQKNHEVPKPDGGN
ncbi:MAG: hypothetical protein KDA42_13870 [Planctomycetales bacterium]|nr:hypothetical protein [Planctomycetales bacterium]